MNQVYFKDVPTVGSLYLEKTLFSFENIPIVFVCLDKDNKRYLCLCDDIIDEESWIIVQISNKTLLSVLFDEITVLSAFRNKKITIANKCFDTAIRYRIEDYNQIDPDELPVSDQYLEMKEYLSEYIDKIARSSFTDSLPTSEYIPQNRANAFLEYILNINISHGQLHKSYFDSREQLTVNTLSYHNDVTFEIELEYEETNKEQREWFDYGTIIYAA